MRRFRYPGTLVAVSDPEIGRTTRLVIGWSRDGGQECS